MMNTLLEYFPLIWIVAGIILILLEFVVPGLVIIFFGIGALVTGIALYFGLTMTSGIPFFVFSGVSILSLFGLRRHFKRIFVGTSIEGDGDPAATGDDIVGKEARVVSVSSEDPWEGKVELRGATWNARSPTPIETGARVRVIARHGLHLDVEKA